MNSPKPISFCENRVIGRKTTLVIQSCFAMRTSLLG
jgi:hypothetical protein